MSDIVIRAENLGKKYTIGHQAENGRYVALRDVLMQTARNLWHKTKDLARGKPIIIGDEMEEVLALNDVNFEVQRGEVVGIIGRNGAGKSTLLKVLSRITEPSAGRVTIKGRIASLLEVGTGFHPELTGRENIYLNGAILGMTRQEIKRKFDEIVAFAEVEKFLDTPVKRYSSGMYVRLAFAVAAHLEPEILLVDEVLSVGDAAFQKKSLSKMGDVAREGRTVLFVSHNMGAIQSLTKRCLVLNNGGLIIDNTSSNAIEAYMKSIPSVSNDSRNFKTEISDFYIKSIKIDKEQLEYGFNKPLKFDLYLSSERDIEGLMIGLQIINSIGARIMTPRIVIPRLGSGDSIVSVILKNHYLPPGYYAVNLGMSLSEAGNGFFYKTSVLSFEISEIGIEDPFLTSRRDKLGVCLPAKYNIRNIK